MFLMNAITRARKGGFTLVELLIVIIIIAILAGMMMLTTGSATDRAEATKIINDLRNLKAASLMYYVDNKTWPLPGGTGNAGWNTSFEKYLDRSIDKKYGNILSNGAATSEKIYVGFTISDAKGIGSGVRDKLKQSAAEAGLYYPADAGLQHYAGEDTIYMPMK